jgi:hypothetical protein
MDDLSEAMAEAIENSDFFRKLQESADEETQQMETEA